MSSNEGNGAQEENLAASNISVSSINPEAENEEILCYWVQHHRLLNRCLRGPVGMLAHRSDPENLAPMQLLKRAAAKQLIERYYYQLTDGCGNPNCNNAHCASSTAFSLKNATKSQMAVHAIELFKKAASLCDSERSKVARQQKSEGGEASTSSTAGTTMAEGPATETKPEGVGTEGSGGTGGMATESSQSGYKITAAQKPDVAEKSPALKEMKYLSEEKLLNIIEMCKTAGSYSLLIRTIGEVYNNPESLMLSFRQSPVPKEEIRTMQGDLDKDTDEKAESDEDELASVRLRADEGASAVAGKDEHLAGNSFDVDIDSLRRSYAALMDIPDHPFQGALINALLYLSRTVDIDLRYNKPLDKDQNYLNIFIIVMEIPCLQSPEFVESAFPEFCKVTGNLPLKAQAKLAWYWSTFTSDRLHQMVESLQQLITVKVIKGEGTWSRPSSVNDDDGITGAAKVMKILYYASICGGKLDSESLLEAEKNSVVSDDPFSDLFQGAVGRDTKEPRQQKEDPLGKELGVDPINCRKPLIPFEMFVNEPLSESIDIPMDYANYIADDKTKFSFVSHSFILTTASKHMSMYFDNRMRMLNERRTSWLHAIVHGDPSMPFLRLRVRRDHLIDDALVGLEMVAMEKPSDLKKQLFVEFEGEQGLDEGGVSKEFFQLVVEEIFNPDFGMFTYNEETEQFWFNPTSFENDGQFTLIGIVLGLAIYNSAILDVHFPMVVYRKLMGKLGTFDDLVDMDPVLYSSLKDILEFEGDVENTFLQTFCIGYHDVFGSQLNHSLKDKGEEIPVTNDNRQEFVDLYADFLMNKSIEKQFRAFKRGFQMVTDESPLKLLFRPEEIELLVCGNKKFDFKALEQATEYDGGFTKTSQAIKYFWETVHEFSEEQKKKLLQFTTGTDRVPVGGLEKLKLIIARNGPDSDRLPTSHTCFNVLLLPDYSSKDKLKERLLKAITYSKGFGML